ncbi:MAG: DUF31 family putative serine protease [Mycoplasmoidaceae bacterium]
MKLNKFLIPMSIISLASASVSLIGCGGLPTPPDPPAPETIETFIQDRTFSLMASNWFTETPESITAKVFSCYGTGWIIDDATIDNPNDYVYYVATNWHVIRGMDTIRTTYQDWYYQGKTYSYGDITLASDSSKCLSFNDYEYFKAGKFEYQDLTNFLYPPTTDTNGIDFYVAKCDFGTQPTKTIKAKFDRLNTQRKNKGYINQFASIDDEGIIEAKKYIGGYPYKEVSTAVRGGQWEFHEIDPGKFSYKEKGYGPHWIDNEAYGYKDISPQYRTDYNYGTDWMTGGASGSMLLTEDFKICAIYWGGEVDSSESPTWFRPRFSILKNNTDTDFISQWVNKQ